VLYYIATCGNTKAYACPSASGLVVPRMSSIVNGTPAHFLLHKHDGGTLNCTNNEPNSWMSVDLGEGRSLVVNYYSLRHGGDDGRLLRAWVLEGSNDGSNWIVLRAHTNDDSLPREAFSVAAWKVEGAAQACRHFRIRQTGRNSRGFHFLGCAGIELWGRLLSR
jgi:E3 ubiquitin-protein ligase HECTD1